MTRIQRRVYLAAFALLLLGLVVPGISVWLNEDYNRGAIEKIFHGQMSLAADAVRAAADPAEAMAELDQRFDFPVELVSLPVAGIPAATSAAWPVDEVEIWVGADDVVVAYYPLSAGQALRFGPLPRLRYYGVRGLVLTLILVAICGTLMVRAIVRPLQRQGQELATASDQVTAGDLTARIDPSRVPDLPELTRAFNQMIDRIQQLLSGQRQLLQDVSHELRTPLARIRFGLEMLGDGPADPADAERVLGMLDETIENLDRLVGELLEYTRLADQDRLLGRHDRVDPGRLVEEAVARVSLERERGLDVSVETGSAALPALRGNPRELGRALDNLLANAQRFASGRVLVSAQVRGQELVLAVEDDGPGIPPDRRERVLEPFVQLERDPGHSGLGLAIVQRIARGHGGRVRVEASNRLGGARLELIFPVGGPDEAGPRSLG